MVIQYKTSLSSPINQKFNLEDGSDWNMDHFFHAMKAVKFLQKSDVSNKANF